MYDCLLFVLKGTYGGVWLVRQKETGDLYAMKVIDVSSTIDKGDASELENL